MKKKCKDCEKEKPLSEFPLTGRNKGHRSDCKICFAKKMREKYWTKYSLNRNQNPHILASIKSIIVNANYLEKEISRIRGDIQAKDIKNDIGNKGLKMALETLQGINEIGGFKIIRVKPPEMSWEDFDKLRNEYPINITEGLNCISFKIQNGPIKEVGVNGCQVDTIIEAAKIIVEGLNEQFPCRENAMIITKLDEALMWSLKRKMDRENRGVEGKSEA